MSGGLSGSDMWPDAVRLVLSKLASKRCVAPRSIRWMFRIIHGALESLEQDPAMLVKAGGRRRDKGEVVIFDVVNVYATQDHFKSQKQTVIDLICG